MTEELRAALAALAAQYQEEGLRRDAQALSERYRTRTGEGARLLTAAAPGGGIADDLRMLGLLFLPVHGTIHKRFDTVLEGLAAGRYTSALELRHALGCLADGRSA